MGSIAMKEKSKIPTPKKSWSMKNQSGAAMVEYALLVVLIATGCILTVGRVGNAVNNMYSNVANELRLACGQIGSPC